jgi:hypothetical protein
MYVIMLLVLGILLIILLLIIIISILHLRPTNCSISTTYVNSQGAFMSLVLSLAHCLELQLNAFSISSIVSF